MNYQEVFQPVFNKLGFRITKIFREGPRFYVAGGEYCPSPRSGCNFPSESYRPPKADKGEKAIFKADIEAGPRRLPKARLRLQREAIFLEGVDLKHAPKFYAKGIHQGFFWVLEEWVLGESQELGESTFLIRDSFFTKQNLKYSLEFLTELRRLSEVPQPEFERHFGRYTLADYENLIWVDRDHILGEALSVKVGNFIKKRHSLFNKNQTTITHHEICGPHIFVKEACPQRLSASDGGRGQMKVIDWENVGWGNPVHDFTELWVRSFAHQDFQTELFERFRALQRDKEVVPTGRQVFDQLFRLEVILQGIGNLNHFKITRVPEEKKVAKEVSSFLLENIERALC